MCKAVMTMKFLEIAGFILWTIVCIWLWPKFWAKIKNLRKKSKKEITYINMPISSESEDKIGILQYAIELKAAIKNGAQSIAITSDFGGGKSSLVRRLESLYCRLFTKFCYINLWSQMHSSDEETKELHKSFIYQLGSQISTKKGNYISRRLSKNYGMLGITLPSIFSTVASFLMCLLFAIGFACTSLYETISEYIAFEFYTENHGWLGQASFILAGVIALLLLYKTDIVFSSKNSEATRTIDEHELMDIYKTHICRFHLRHYVVVIEDLDRSEKEAVNRFIKELRRYYVPHKRKRWWFPWWVNRITFIVNIKGEYHIAGEKDEHLYGKAFDYVLNLKDIHVDNFDVILKKLLEDNRQYFESEQIYAFNSKSEFLSEFEWLIRGKDIGLREIKNRLNTAILTYVNLRSKFDADGISMPKCIAAAYVTSVCEKEHQNIKSLDFEKMIDMYVTNSNLSAKDVSAYFAEGNSTISKEFADDLKTLIENGLIASDYKQYFYNFPMDSYLLDANQNKMVNLILYNEGIKSPQALHELTDKVLQKDEAVVTNCFDRLKRLSKNYPHCIFSDSRLFELAWIHDIDMMLKTLAQTFSYDETSIAETAKDLLPIIESNIIDRADRIDVLCDILKEQSSAKALVTFRRQLIERIPTQLLQFKSLFFDGSPLITQTEIESLCGKVCLTDLVNLNSPEINIGTIQEVHKNLLHELELLDNAGLRNIVSFYERVYEVMGEKENTALTENIFEFMNQLGMIFEPLETIVIDNNDREDILESYTHLVNCAEEKNALSPNTIDRVVELKISNGLSRGMCQRLHETEHFENFVINAVSTDIGLINFKDPRIVDAVASLDFLDSSNPMNLQGLLTSIRSWLLEIAQEYMDKPYGHLFMSPYPLISENELSRIQNTTLALHLIDAEQVSVEHCEYIAGYLSRQNSDITQTYEILSFVCAIEDKNAKHELVYALDFDRLCYFRMSKQRKEEIVDKLSDSFDFEDIEVQINFMHQTRCSYEPFELQISKEIKENGFEEYKEAYSKYVKVAKNTTNTTIHNLCATKSTYPMPPHILKKIYSAKKYSYYVVSKTLAENHFEMENDKLGVLLPIYEQILLSDEDLYPKTKKRMSENSDFISYMAERKTYEGTPEHTRLLFSSCLQSEELLTDLFENYEDNFIIAYLSQNLGFQDRKAALKFLRIIKQNKAIATSDKVYEHNYERLLDGTLKRSFTKMHNSAKKENQT